MDRLYGFPPVINGHSKVLVLGSMPGVRSLQLQEYYGHPQNKFWSIMGALFSAWPAIEYAERCDCLLQNKVALWDVIDQCAREGSMDSAIVETSVKVNDFNRLLKRHPGICHIFFNGRKAEPCWNRYVQPSLDPTLYHLELTCLPSTSPANARLSLEQKLCEWQQIKQRLLDH